MNSVKVILTWSQPHQKYRAAQFIQMWQCNLKCYSNSKSSISFDEVKHVTEQHCNEVQAYKSLYKFSRSKKLFLTTNVKSNYITVSVEIFAVWFFFFLTYQAALHKWLYAYADKITDVTTAQWWESLRFTLWWHCKLSLSTNGAEQRRQLH